MTVKTYPVQYYMDDGYADAGTSVTFVNNSGNVAISVGLTAIARFANIDIPSGSTINSATLRMWFWQKSSTTPAAIGMSIFMEDVDSSPELVTGTYEDNRVRTTNVVNHTYNFDTAGPADQQYTVTGLGPVLQEVIDRPGWKPWGSVTILNDITSESGGDVYVGFYDGYGGGWTLEVDYTPPANDTLVVPNLVRNGNFELSSQYWEANTAFGAFVAPQSYTTSTEQAKFGTKSLKVVWPDGKSFVNHFALATTINKWYVFSMWVYVPSGSPDVFLDNLFKATGSPTSVKNQWVRISLPFISTDDYSFLGLGMGTTGQAGTVAYIDGVMLTEGKELHEYFDGDTTDDTYRNFQWSSDTYHSVSTMTGKKSTLSNVTGINGYLPNGPGISWQHNVSPTETQSRYQIRWRTP